MIAQFDGFEINPIHEGDAWKICDFVIANTDRLKRYFPKTLEQNLNPTLSQIYVENRVKAFQNKDGFVFTLKQIETRKLIGLIILKELNWTSKQGEFAYAIDYNFNGKGLMSKAIEKLSVYAFETLGLERLQIISHKENRSSVKVALNNHFEWQKTLKNEFTPKGEQPLDMELYELYKD
ncbi:GNAT family N-acetyltransferase [Psychroserpens ponticola]|uniref:GNAT family N-acetyltransferase n=1 Tax=Psychroserpens ponticola TaxID=2932268 RepID=A0ABY7RXY5_9FLAO|nr:GNAT family N-acetyltransferase [Psychroserpens ponticola]WCO01580.1 GNAT family N-acetyltransferase [Psychroserpens ponticola]